ncbi:hypothetical protein DFH09DRAFT_1330208 [Mycena vulgaris]|nr:hypothetical protein DFH09DRAFT_1330208 [Mycena vulgaris]
MTSQPSVNGIKVLLPRIAPFMVFHAVFPLPCPKLQPAVVLSDHPLSHHLWVFVVPHRLVSKFDNLPSNEQFRLDEDSNADGNVTLEHLRARSRCLASIAKLTPPRSPAQAPEDDGEPNCDEPSRQRRRLTREPSVVPTTRQLRPRAPNPAPAKVSKKAPAKPKDKGKLVNRSSRMSTGGHPIIQQFANTVSVEPSEPNELATAIPSDVQEPEAGQKRKHASSKAKSNNPKPSKGKAVAKAKEPTKPYSHPQPICSGRGDAVTKKQYIPSAPVPDVNVVGLLDVMSRPGPGRVIDSGCYSCISFNRECKPNGIMEKCGACTTQSDSHCGHSLTYFEHAARLNHAQPHSQLSNAALNSAIEQLTWASDTLAGMQAMFNEQRLLTMSAAHHLLSLVLAHYQFFGSVAVPDLHNVPEHLRETYNMFLLSNALELDLPYLDTEEVLRLEGAQFTPLPIEGECTVRWAEELLGYSVSPPSCHPSLTPDTRGEGGSQFPGAMDDSAA